jgi:hypothetical protein
VAFTSREDVADLTRFIIERQSYVDPAVVGRLITGTLTAVSALGMTAGAAAWLHPERIDTIVPYVAGGCLVALPAAFALIANRFKRKQP